jgi:hypothetical protein
MTPQEKARSLRPLIEKASASLSDTDALEAVELFEEYKVGKAYKAGDRFRFGNNLYKVNQDHISQADWPPNQTPALYSEVAKPGDGTRDNPIAYNGNMALEKGKYYTQDGVEYICTRDTVNPVYNALKDLVGLYVEIVE